MPPLNFIAVFDRQIAITVTDDIFFQESRQRIIWWFFRQLSLLTCLLHISPYSHSNFPFVCRTVTLPKMRLCLQQIFPYPDIYHRNPSILCLSHLYYILEVAELFCWKNERVSYWYTLKS